jgi:hypothetical protein
MIDINIKMINNRSKNRKFNEHNQKNQKLFFRSLNKERQILHKDQKEKLIKNQNRSIKRIIKN